MITLLHSLKDVALKDESSNRMTHMYLLQALISADFCCRSYRATSGRMPARARPPARVPSNWCRLLDTANRMMKKRGHGATQSIGNSTLRF